MQKAFSAAAKIFFFYTYLHFLLFFAIFALNYFEIWKLPPIKLELLTLTFKLLDF